MAAWRYTCKLGAQLREAIDEGNCPLTLRMLRACIHEILRYFPKTAEDYEDLVCDLNDLLCYTEGEEELVGDPNFLDAYCDDPDELVDLRLHEFYDLCDNYRIFVAL